MEVFKAVQTVLAIRTYRPEALPPEIVHRILEAGRLTASSMNLQPWHFIAVEDRQDLEALGELAKTGPYIKKAGMAVAVAIKPTKYAESDASRAIQSMILTAWEAGVASKLGGFLRPREGEKILEHSG
ncbi:MAG: nitroreductase family protein [Anaerolineales bacterium]|jgi:nitroreductase